jgi:hypothetical protein
LKRNDLSAVDRANRADERRSPVMMMAAAPMSLRHFGRFFGEPQCIFVPLFRRSSHVPHPAAPRPPKPDRLSVLAGLTVLERSIMVDRFASGERT